MRNLDSLEQSQATQIYVQGVKPMKVLRTLLTIWGGFMLVFAPMTMLVQTRYFLSARYEGLWSDAQAYYLQLPMAKSREELLAKYGAGPVRDYIDEKRPFVYAAFIPSEKSAIAAVVATAVASKEKKDGPPAWWVFLLMLLTVYAPMVYALRRFHRRVTDRYCTTAIAKEVRDEFWAANHVRKPRAIAIVVLATFLMAWINALTSMTEQLRANGITMLDLTAGALSVGFFGGFGLQLVAVFLQTLFLRAGKNPHLSLWDDGIAVVLTAPVLFFVYQNDIAAVLTNVVAGISEGVYVKWVVHKRR